MIISSLFSPSVFFFSMLLLWAVGCFGSLVLRNNDRLANWWANSFAFLGAVSGLISSLITLTTGLGFSFHKFSSLPLLSVSFGIDRLSAFFIFVVSLIALVSSIYAFGYVQHFYKKYNIGSLGFFYNLFLIGMATVVSADNLFFFLIVWEIMSVSSYFLVIFENKEKENIKAGLLYFIMTHLGTAFITLAFLLLYRFTGSLDFTMIKEGMLTASPFLKNTIFILALLGFGTKAGIVPFHIWLPSAHPAAPSHVSALMSGVMIKTGVYMFIRIFFDIMPGVPLWWGIVILLFGAISSLLGILYALTENDIKKLLAYSSIENIGIILIGLGSALVFWSLDMKSLAILGLTAALFHILNHAVFKALLFMGAGAVISKTHTRNIEEYGGLIRFMPQTAFFFLIGSVAISALPPFNGFISEWLTFQALFNGIIHTGNSVNWVFILAASSLAFTGGLAAMCFVKVFGISFLARPRREEVTPVKEVKFTLRVGMAILAAFTLLFGVFAGNITNFLTAIVKDLSIFNITATVLYADMAAVGLRDNFAIVSLPFVFISLIVSLVIVALVVKLFTLNRKIKTGPTWDCGTEQGPRMEITATGFARSIIAIFHGVLKPTKQVNIEYCDANMRYFSKTSKVDLGIKDLYHEHFYQPVRELTIKISEQVKKIQNGSVNMYILYILSALIILLLFSTF